MCRLRGRVPHDEAREAVEERELATSDVGRVVELNPDERTEEVRFCDGRVDQSQAPTR
mgnify:FL=1